MAAHRKKKTTGASHQAIPGDVRRAIRQIGAHGPATGESELRRFLRRQPKHVLATCAYANLLMLTGRPLQAIEKLDSLLTVYPGNANLLLTRARARHVAGDLEASRADILEVTRHEDEGSPVHAEACYLMGRQFLDAQALSSAITWLEAACRLRHERSADYLLHLGIARMRAGSWKNAIAALEQGLAIKPEFVDLHLALAEACRLSADVARARSEYGQSLRLAPNHPRAVAGLAQLALTENQIDEAERILQSAMLAPGQAAPHPEVTTIFVRVCRRRERPGDAIGALRSALKSQALSPMQKAQLWSDLGSLLEQHEHDYQQAFECFRKSNLALAAGRVDLNAETARVDRTIGAFRPDVVARLHHATAIAGARMVFIVGMPRSGTSLIEQIIASHPRAFGAGELDRLSAAAAMLAQLDEPHHRSFPDYIADLTPEMLDKAADTYHDHVNGMLSDAHDSIRIVTDKMPHNYHYVGLIPMLFPGAKVIHCRRHPLDTCLSCYATPLNPALTYTTNLNALGHVYRQYDRLMQHWRCLAESHGLCMLDVRYENLVNDLDSGARELLAFCGLEWDAQCLRFHEAQRTVATASTEQVRTPLYRSSVARYQHYETQLAGLADDLADLIDAYEPNAGHGRRMHSYRSA